QTVRAIAVLRDGPAKSLRGLLGRSSVALRHMRLARIVIAAVSLLALSSVATAQDVPTADTEVVVLLHGLARSSSSMSRLAHSLESAGYRVCNLSYPSRKYSIEKLTIEFVAEEVRACVADTTVPVNFVTHSLGGIIVRQLAVSAPDIRIRRVVMLSPPNHGSEAVDKLGGLFLFRLLNGPAGQELGTDSYSVPRSLGEPSFDLGIITGNRSFNPLLSKLIPGEDDGKVSLESAKLDAMKDFLVISSSHPFIMKNSEAIMQTLNFLHDGAFIHPAHKPLQPIEH
ncbi:MAG: esterase/lipase family protein, partial [Povalibacter sp.]